MPLFAATPAEFQTVADLVNSAYRGDCSRQGWTSEADLVGGQRTDPVSLAQDLAAQPDARLLVFRDDPRGEILGCVQIHPIGPSVWYLGMLSIRPWLQDRRLGRAMLDQAEALAKAEGAQTMRITVVSIRDTLIAWYQRRGYVATGATEPFPYDDLKFGEPKLPGLKFVIMEKAL
jgi:ribosomal protein S18 acetylase RimI-like enzyme